MSRQLQYILRYPVDDENRLEQYSEAATLYLQGVIFNNLHIRLLEIHLISISANKCS